MRGISVNFNRIRAVCSKDLLPWLAQQAVCITCVQELKAHPNSSAAWPGTIPSLAFIDKLEANPSRAQRINKPNHWQKWSASRVHY